MKLLHIANDYFGSSVHKSLDKSLVDIDDKLQIVTYVARKYKLRSRETFESSGKCSDNINVICSYILKFYHRFLYKERLYIQIQDIENSVRCIETFSSILASTLCADGGVAYELYKRYKIPYIVCVRDTDINFYFRILSIYRAYYYEILLNASRIIFLSENAKNFFIRSVLPLHISLKIKGRCSVILNGINSCFLTNRHYKLQGIHQPSRILFYGGVIKRKNIIRTINAIKNIRARGIDLEFAIIGKGCDRFGESKYSEEVWRIANKFSWITVMGKMTQEELINEINKHDIFITVSHLETFGLVYVEALSQGLPIVYTKDQGFDGVYKDNMIGYSAYSNNIQSIEKAIMSVVDNYSVLVHNISHLTLNNFEWSFIAKQYYDLFQMLKE